MFTKLSDQRGNSTPVISEVNASKITEYEVYEVQITPDPIYGLGMSLDAKRDEETGKESIVVIGFKSHPITQTPLPAEDCGYVNIGDELLRINGTSLRGYPSLCLLAFFPLKTTE